MTGRERNEELKSGNDAFASLPPAVQPVRAVDVADPLSDTTSFLQGAQLIGSKVSRSAGRMGLDEGPFALYAKAQIEKDKREADEARELAMLAAWNQQKTTVGGVEMTNGEAQEARQRVIDNDEAYANWAVKTGRIRDDEKDDFKAAIRRKKDLEDKRGRGTLTEAEAAEADRLDRSRAGKAADAATAESHTKRGLEASMEAQASNVVGRAADKPTALISDALFQNAADMTTARQAAVSPAMAPIAPKVRATGLEL